MAALDRGTLLQSAARHAERRQYDQAIDDYRKVIAIDPCDARTLLKIGDLEHRRGAWADAVEAYALAGDVYAAQGHAQKTVATLTRVRELIATRAPHLEEKYAHVPFAIAEAYQQLGLTSDAIAVLGDLARDLERRGDEAKAVAVLERATRIDPEDPKARLRLAEAASRRGDFGRAAEELGAAATHLAKKGRTEDALLVIERLLHHVQDPSFARHAAELYLARRTPEDATRALRKLQICLRADANDLDALRLLAEAFALLGQEAKVEEVRREIEAIAGARGVPPLPLDDPFDAPTERRESSAVQVIPVSPESWNAIASRLEGPESGREQVLAFVCAPEGERSTIRTIYGVVKILFD